jgi:hypothetical protein
MLCEMRKRCGSARFGVLLMVIGLLWLAQRLGWFPPGIFGPLLVLVIGGWLCIVHYFLDRQDESNGRKTGSCFLSGGQKNGKDHG